MPGRYARADCLSSPTEMTWRALLKRVELMPEHQDLGCKTPLRFEALLRA
jgi:hypothetical protein